MNESLNIYDLTHDQLVGVLSELGEPKFRAKQVWEWLYKKYVTEFAEMRNLPKI